MKISSKFSNIITSSGSNSAPLVFIKWKAFSGISEQLYKEYYKKVNSCKLYCFHTL